MGSTPVVAYFYAVRDNTVDGFSLSPAVIILIGGVTISLVLAIAVLGLYRWKKLKHH